jgi:dolichyl-diphosphooligosaccharide--protein glycosyltransferase
MFAGSDSWYHYRMVSYTVRNWPFTMPFDVWTSFPQGTRVGQFGTLFDQLIATAALVVGLGSPTDHQVALVHLFAPAVFGAATVIPVYYLGKRLSGRLGGLTGALLLALTPGEFLTRSVAGFSDHHVAEAFFHVIAFVLILAALDVAQRELPVWELFESSDWAELREPLLWAGAAGIGIALYLWTWPPGVFLLGIVAIGLAVTMAVHHVRGVSPDHVAIAGAATMVVTAVLMLVRVRTVALSATDFTPLHPLLALLVAAGCAFMAWLARQWDARDVDRVYYPVGVAGIAVAGVVAFSVLFPSVFDYFVRQVVRIIGLEAGAQARTVGEAQPVPLDEALSARFFYGSYGLALYAAAVGYLLVLYRVVTDDQPRAAEVLALVWVVFIVLAALTQRRFDYYLALAVAGFTAVAADWAFGLVGIDELGEDIASVEAYQVLTVLAVVMLVVAPLAAAQGNALETADRRSNPGSVVVWDDSLDWMDENTPEQGTYGGADNAGRLDYYGTYGQTDDFAYADGEYGVISWWDYGHWITLLGERAAVANPFQQGANKAANFLLATNETRANELMASDDGEPTRYVMIDWQLGAAERIRQTSQGAQPVPTRKYSAPTAFYNRGGEELGTRDAYFRVFTPNGRLANVVQTNRSYHTMRTRLYQFHGSARDPRPVVFDWRCSKPRNSDTAFAFAPSDQQVIKQFNNTAEARSYVGQDGPDGCEGTNLLYNGSSSQLGGVPGFPTERIPALERYRLVHVNPNQSPTRFRSSAVKTFERVPGATVVGEGPPNETVRAGITMETNTGERFRYMQYAETGPDGRFTMTVPYSSTGYENWGPEEGYTNVSVRPVGNYSVRVLSTRVDNGTVYRSRSTFDATEGQVLGEDDSPVRVTLEEEVVAEFTGNDDGNASDGNTTDGGSGDGPSGNDTNTSSALAPPDGGSHQSAIARPG